MVKPATRMMRMMVATIVLMLMVIAIMTMVLDHIEEVEGE